MKAIPLGRRIGLRNDDIPIPYRPDLRPGMIAASGALTGRHLRPISSPSATASSASRPAIEWPSGPVNSPGGLAALIATVMEPSAMIALGTSAAVIGSAGGSEIVGAGA